MEMERTADKNRNSSTGRNRRSAHTQSKECSRCRQDTKEGRVFGHTRRTGLTGKTGALSRNGQHTIRTVGHMLMARGTHSLGGIGYGSKRTWAAMAVAVAAKPAARAETLVGTQQSRRCHTRSLYRSR